MKKKTVLTNKLKRARGAPILVKKGEGELEGKTDVRVACASI